MFPIIIRILTLFTLFGATYQFTTTDFYLFTNTGNERDLMIEKYNDEELKANNESYVFIIHGDDDGDNSKAPVYEMIVRTYERKRKNHGDNFILVDWSNVEEGGLFHFGKGKDCKSLIERIQKAGNEILTFVIRHDLPSERIHLIGYSEGAHVAAAAANQFPEWFLAKPHKLTALDPAGKCFESLNEENRAVRLNNDAAEIVNVLHTNAGGYGLEDPNVGTVRFYANGGRTQPGCKEQDNLCSHRRSLLLFNESIALGNFAGRSCENGECDENAYVIFSPETEVERARAGFYFDTNAEWPYGKLDPPKKIQHVNKNQL